MTLLHHARQPGRGNVALIAPLRRENFTSPGHSQCAEVAPPQPRRLLTDEPSRILLRDDGAFLVLGIDADG